MNKLCLILFFMCLRVALLAQTSGYKITAANKGIKIALKDITGEWFALDSNASKISFINLNNVLVEINGIKHGFGNYSFAVDGDSLSVNGTAANWPPYNCTLRLIQNNQLEIGFYQFFSAATTRIIYVRINNR